MHLSKSFPLYELLDHRVLLGKEVRHEVPDLCGFVGHATWPEGETHPLCSFCLLLHDEIPKFQDAHLLKRFRQLTVLLLPRLLRQRCTDRFQALLLLERFHQRVRGN